MSNCCGAACQIYRDWIIPEGMIQRRLGKFYANHPIMSRIIASTYGVLGGFIKTFLIPLISLVGTVVMPIIALARFVFKKRDAGDWLKAWAFTFITFTASCVFLALACYDLRLIQTSILISTFIASSIIGHVYTLIKEPPAQKI